MIKKRISIEVLILSLVFLNFVSAQEGPRITDPLGIIYEDVRLKSSDSLSLQEVLDNINQRYGVHFDIYTTESRKGEDVSTFANRIWKEELGLDKRGIPALNVLFLLIKDEKKVRIITSEGCGLSKEALSELRKNIQNALDEVAKNPRDFASRKELREKAVSYALLESLQYGYYVEQTSKLFAELKEKSTTLTCSDIDPEALKVDRGSCKQLFPGAENTDKRKFLFLGSSFENEEEFKNWILDVGLKEGFMNIEPFKSYTKNGYDGDFYFVYGNHDIKAEYENGFLGGSLRDDNLPRRIGKIQCPNVDLYILVQKNWGEVASEQHKGGTIQGLDFAGYYQDGYATIVTRDDPGTLMHEVGHHFDLSDEYFKGDRFRAYGRSCSKDPSIWEAYYGELVSSFKPCINNKNYRSSLNSIMRGSREGSKFNLYSCMIIISQIEKKKLKDPEVYQKCKTMYDEGFLERNTRLLRKNPLVDQTNTHTTQEIADILTSLDKELWLEVTGADSDRTIIYLEKGYTNEYYLNFLADLSNKLYVDMFFLEQHDSRGNYVSDGYRTNDPFAYFGLESYSTIVGLEDSQTIKEYSLLTNIKLLTNPLYYPIKNAEGKITHWKKNSTIDAEIKMSFSQMGISQLQYPELAELVSDEDFLNEEDPLSKFDIELQNIVLSNRFKKFDDIIDNRLGTGEVGVIFTETRGGEALINELHKKGIGTIIIPQGVIIKYNLNNPTN